MISNVSFFGNHSTTLYGVGLLHYSILYGFFGGVFVLLLAANIFLKNIILFFIY